LNKRNLKSGAGAGITVVVLTTAGNVTADGMEASADRWGMTGVSVAADASATSTTESYGSSFCN
jgi:hypothetical protein